MDGILAILALLGQWVDGNERLCAMKPRSRLQISPRQAWIEPGTVRSLSQRFTH